MLENNFNVNHIGLYVYRFDKPCFAYQNYSPLNLIDIYKIIPVIDMVKTAFNTINHSQISDCCEFDDLLYKQILCDMEQHINPHIKTILVNAIRVRKYRKQRTKLLAVNFLQNWKEHYYNPDNKQGFVRHLTTLQY